MQALMEQMLSALNILNRASNIIGKFFSWIDAVND
jgi:hypothetical protein